MSDIPSAWTRGQLAEIAHVEMGQSPDSRFYNDRGEGLPFFQGKAEFGALYPTVRKWCAEPTKIAEAGDILLSVRAPVGPTNVANVQCCIGRGLSAIHATAPISQKYLLHFFRHVEPWLAQQGTGTTFTAVSGGFLRELEVPLAPLPEQKRIADKLDTVLARVDACRDRLDRIPAILKRFRQSVLAAATTGKLTDDWRANQVARMQPQVESGNIVRDSAQSRYAVTPPPDSATLHPGYVAGKQTKEWNSVSEPVEWNTLSLSAICLSITDGDHQAPPQAETGIPFITISAINDGKLRLEKASRYVPAAYFDALKESRRPQRGDILFSVTGSIGIPAMVDTDSAFTFQRHIAILRPDPSKISSSYLKFVLGADSVQQQALAVATGTAQLTIPLNGLRSFMIELPPREEQTEIVRRVESLFAYADRLEARFTAARAQVENLTSATLAKAFRGELVPQDPSDEPASKLLERIRAMSTPESSKPRGRKLKAKETVS